MRYFSLISRFLVPSLRLAGIRSLFRIANAELCFQYSRFDESASCGYARHMSRFPTENFTSAHIYERCFRIRLIPQLLRNRRSCKLGRFCMRATRVRVSLGEHQVRANRERDSCHSANIHHPRGWYIIPTSGVHSARSIILRARCNVHHVCARVYQNLPAVRSDSETGAIVLPVI